MNVNGYGKSRLAAMAGCIKLIHWKKIFLTIFPHVSKLKPQQTDPPSE
jgi:hypothetical protein